MKFTKHDSVKSRLDLVPGNALDLVGFVLRHGAVVYEAENWRKCKQGVRYVAAMLRHAYKHLNGEYLDKHSSLPHLAHAVTSGLFALELFFKGVQTTNMERKQFSYFAIVERKSKKRGVVKKRFRSYEKIWKYFTDEGLDPSKHIIRTVEPKEKVNSLVCL